jgi:aminopeptidase N
VQIYTTVASSIRDENDQLKFYQFLITRTELAGAEFQTLSRTMSTNLDQQRTTVNVKQLQEIERILHEWDHGIVDEGRVWLLPPTSRPEHYKIHLDVRNIHTGIRDFIGDATIHVEILEKTDRIIFHSKNQVFTSITAVNRASNMEVPIAKYRLTPSHETIMIYFTSEQPIGTKLEINLKYSTYLVTTTTGFFQTTYTLDGQLKYVGQTQFQRTGARYAFPCYDQPEFKTRFELSFTHNDSVNALANTVGTSTTK